MAKRARSLVAVTVLLFVGLSLALVMMSTTSPTVRADPGVWYVKPIASGAEDCSSWENACTLQPALADAQNGDEIWVAAGIHYPGTDCTDTFTLRNGVAIYGGFAGTETQRDQRDWENNVTVLSGDIDGDDLTDPHGVVTTTAHISGTNAYHVVTAGGVTETAVLDGFFVTAGQANGSVWHELRGGGMYNSGNPTIRNVTFSGNSATNNGGGMYNEGASPTLTDVTFSGNSAGSGGGMHNQEGASPTLTDVTFSGNSATTSGGGMANSYGSSPVLTGVDFFTNTAGSDGGGMFNGTSSPTLTDVTFSDNAAGSNGGGMYSSFSSPTLTNVTFSGNHANYGGGMNNQVGSPVLTSVDFFTNTAGSDGGGMFNGASSPTLTDVTFSDNAAGRDGGGMYNWSSSSPTLNDVDFSGNSAITSGGGMYSRSSSSALTNVTFSGNYASFGGGMYNEQSSPVLTHVTFYSNSATTSSGGGMYNYNSSSPTLTDVIFSGNLAATDGGGMRNQGSSPTLTNVTFSGNSATDNGGAMYSSFSSPTLTNVTFSGNSATTSGGGMYNFSGSPTLTNVAVFGNSATTSGGGMYNFSGSPTLTNVSFFDNSATTSGGGMYNYSSSPTLTNSTFSGNSADIGGGIYNWSSSSPTLTNIILWGNSAASGAEIHNQDSGSIPAIAHSDIQGCGGSGGGWVSSCGTDNGGNIDDDPLFVDADNGDLRLGPGSPAIDAGDNDAVPPGVTTDLDGKPRIVDGNGDGNAVVDMGAYEAPPPNRAPSFTSAAVTTATQDEPYTYTVTVDDPDLIYDDVLAITAPTLPAWLTLEQTGAVTATLSGTPANADVGDHAVELLVTDSEVLTNTQAFTITVANVNDPPAFTSTPVTTATQDVLYTYVVTVDDPDLIHGDVLTITAPTRPGWLTLTQTGAVTATLSGTPTNADVGDHAVELLVTDSEVLTNTQAFTITVANVNDPPAFTSEPVTTATQDVLYTYVVTVDDPDLAYGDVLTITATTRPGWLTLTQTGAVTATLSGTPTESDLGDHAVVLRVTDSGRLFAEQPFTLTVTTAPLITSADHATFVVGAAGTFTVTAIGIPTPTLAYSGTLPSGVTFADNDDGTATLAGTPEVGSVGVYSLTFTASNGVPPDAVQHFRLTVNTRVYLPLVLRNAQ